MLMTYLGLAGFNNYIRVVTYSQRRLPPGLVSNPRYGLVSDNRLSEMERKLNLLMSAASGISSPIHIEQDCDEKEQPQLPVSQSFINQLSAMTSALKSTSFATAAK